MDGKQKRKRLDIARWICLCLSILFVAAAVCVVAAGIYMRRHFEMTLPEEFLRLAEVGAPPQFYVYRFSDRTDRDGVPEELTTGAFSKTQSNYIEYPDIPEPLINAFIAIEDKRFYSHQGVDWKRTLAAAANRFLGFSGRFGASTITQQLVKNLTGQNEITVKRKLREIFYATDLERRMDKREILELYLNVIHFSDHCDGIAQASRHYFSKEPQDLTLAECASLAAITNNPSYYNPIRHPENNLTRRNLILSEMHSQGYITESEYIEAISEPVKPILSDSSEHESVRSWYVDMALEDVIADLCAEYDISRSAASRYVLSGGLRIDLAMDPAVQQTVEEYYRTAVQVPKNGKGESAQSALIVIDPHTGDILGVAGAVGEKQGNRVQNFATQTKRPPGSVIKPLSVYAPALEKGVINWASVYDDVPVLFPSEGAAWPRNANGVYRGLTNIPYAVANSTNTVSVKVLQELGVENAYRFAKERFHLTGLTSKSGANDCDLAALALGQLNYGVTLRELTAAYTVFADAGVYHPYRSYYRVLDAEGNIILSRPDAGEVVLSEGNAAIMTKLLQGVVDHGTASSITLDRMVECAGKTGTTNADGDRWFVGYTPDLICGVWCGYEYPEPLPGKHVCTQIWNQVMRELVEETGGTGKRFRVPSDVVRVSYCKDSGKLLCEACRHDPRGVRQETGWFLRGSEPTEFCDCHILCRYDVQNGGVSHGNCPEEETEEIALLRINRRFPKQIYVSDAQYVYGGDPLTMPPNENGRQPYFGSLGECCGISGVVEPYHHSCTFHTHPPDLEWDYLDRYFEDPEA